MRLSGSACGRAIDYHYEMTGVMRLSITQAIERREGMETANAFGVAFDAASADCARRRKEALGIPSSRKAKPVPKDTAQPILTSRLLRT